MQVARATPITKIQSSNIIHTLALQKYSLINILSHPKSVYLNETIKKILKKIIITQKNSIQYISLNTESLTPIIEIFNNLSLKSNNNNKYIIKINRLKIKIICNEYMMLSEIKSGLINLKNSMKYLIKNDYMILSIHLMSYV